jgi:hypothetical protein
MSGLHTNWPLVIVAALTSTLIAGAAHARGGGGHGGAISRPITSMSHMATTPSPGIGLSGVHPPSGLPGGGGAMRSAFPVPITPPAIGGRSQSMQRPVGSGAGTGGSSSASNTNALLNSAIGTIPTPPPPGVMPPSAIAAPTPELDPIAPLSPQLQTQFSSGGVVQPNMALSPGVTSSASPSESAPSAPGGGGKSLADCMGFWDRETHMTKTEWKAACLRTMQDYPTVLP